MEKESAGTDRGNLSHREKPEQEPNLMFLAPSDTGDGDGGRGRPASGLFGVGDRWICAFADLGGFFMALVLGVFRVISESSFLLHGVPVAGRLVLTLALRPAVVSVILCSAWRLDHVMYVWFLLLRPASVLTFPGRALFCRLAWVCTLLRFCAD